MGKGIVSFYLPLPGFLLFTAKGIAANTKAVVIWVASVKTDLEISTAYVVKFWYSLTMLTGCPRPCQ